MNFCQSLWHIWNQLCPKDQNIIFFFKGDGPKTKHIPYLWAFWNFIIVTFDIRVPFFRYMSPDSLGHKFQDFLCISDRFRGPRVTPGGLAYFHLGYTIKIQEKNCLIFFLPQNRQILIKIQKVGEFWYWQSLANQNSSSEFRRF